MSTAGRIPRRPALAPCAAFLVALSNDLARPPSAWLVATATAASIAAHLWFATHGRRRLAAASLVALGLAAGWALGSRAARESERRVSGWLPPDGSPQELQLEAKVLRAPEHHRDRTRHVLVSAVPELRIEPGASPARVRLVVPKTGTSGVDVVDRLRRGDRVRVFARLRRTGPIPNAAEGERRRAAWNQGIDATGSVKSSRLVERTRRGRPTPARLIDEFRVALGRRLDLAVGDDPRTRSVLGAMILGERLALDEETRGALRDAGLFHLLAISGLHVGLTVLGGLALARRWGARGAALALPAVLALAGFALLVGAQPPVARACAAAGIAVTGRALGRTGDPVNTLAFVGAMMGMLEPRWLGHAGFQLTFSATAGILLGAGRIAGCVPLPRPLALALGTSVSAYLATAPVLAFHFGRVAPIALLANLAAAPLCAAVLVTGAAAAATASTPLLGDASAACATASVRALEAVAEAAGSLPGASYRVAVPGASVLLAYAILLVLVSADPGLAVGRLGRLARAPLAVLLGVVHLGPLPDRGPRPVEAAVVDVGQGQSVVFRDEDGRCVLVDGGGTSGGRFDAGERIVVPFLLERGCRRVEAVIVSHDHDDHAGGLEAVVRDIEVGAFWIGAGAHAEPTTSRLAELVRIQNGPILLAEPGHELRLTGMVVEVVHPSRRSRALDDNDRSVVVRVRTRDGPAVLVPGDLGERGEHEILSGGRSVTASALVAGHHGARGSSSAPFLEAVAPAIVVVSAGAYNRFGHPAPQFLERVARRGARVLRTDRDGTVVLRRTGRGWVGLTTRERARSAGE